MTDKIRARGLAKNFDKFKLGPNDFAIKKGFVTGFIGKTAWERQLLLRRFYRL